VTSLENVLEFVTGASEEPILGFLKQPSIHFMVAIVSEAKEVEVDNNTNGQVNAQLLDTPRSNQPSVVLILNFESR